jgi:hypothetical protein
LQFVSPYKYLSGSAGTSTHFDVHKWKSKH